MRSLVPVFILMWDTSSCRYQKQKHPKRQGTSLTSTADPPSKKVCRPSLFVISLTTSHCRYSPNLSQLRDYVEKIETVLEHLKSTTIPHTILYTSKPFSDLLTYNHLLPSPRGFDLSFPVPVDFRIPSYAVEQTGYWVKSAILQAGYWAGEWSIPPEHPREAREAESERQGRKCKPAQNTSPPSRWQKRSRL